MSNHNNSLLYYKKYYEGMDWTAPNDPERNKAKFDEVHQTIKASRLPDNPPPSAYPDLTTIELTTTYPGLLLGTGIPHGTGMMGESKIGFFFDYTTGLPVVPGSSVKGVLRSVFPGATQFKGKKARQPEADTMERSAQLEAFLRPLLDKITARTWSRAEVDSLENWLFGAMESGVPASEKPTNHPVFHDTFPVKPKGNLYLDFDFITPHKDPLKNPIPIQFLKVLPGVTFRFQFDLFDYVVEGTTLCTKAQLQQLFKELLCLLGIGAKTNVGYGQFESVGGLENARIEVAQPASRQLNESTPIRKVKVGDVFEATLGNKVAGAPCKARFTTTIIQGVNQFQNIPFAPEKFGSLTVGRRYLLQVTQINGNNIQVVIHSFDPLP